MASPYSTYIPPRTMQMYFQRIGSLAQNAALDSRHKFMLQDMMELRRNKWVLRRKVDSVFIGGNNNIPFCDGLPSLVQPAENCFKRSLECMRDRLGC